MQDFIDKLSLYFEKFPGVGPRQAKRFVYFLLQKGPAHAQELAAAIENLHKSVHTCQDCQIKFSSGNSNSETGANLCHNCADKNRDNSRLLVVARDMDEHVISKSDQFDGRFFVLGGIIPFMEENDAAKFVRINELEKLIERKIPEGLTEIILALNANPEGESTEKFLKKQLEAKFGEKISVTHLGRGLSTGSEIEYADKNTIKSALESRK